MDDDDGSLFEQLLLEACGPLTFRLAGREWTVDVPGRDAVAALDRCDDAADDLDELLGDNIADAVLDALEAFPWATTLDLADEVREHFHLVDAPPSGWAGLVDDVDRYGAAIEADLPAVWPGIELEQWFTGARPWPQLYRLLGQLPPGSRWSAAMLADEDLARAQLEVEAERDDDEDDERADRDRDRPPLVGETYERQLLRAAVSVLLRIEHATYAVHAPRGRAGKPPRPLPGPVTARTLLQRDAGLEEVYEIFAAVDETWRRPEDVGQAPPAGYTTSNSGLLVPEH